MPQKRTFDFSLVLSIIIHSIAALILSLIMIPIKELPTPKEEVIEVEVIRIREHEKIPKTLFEKERMGIMRMPKMVGEKVKVEKPSPHPIVSHRKGIESILERRGIEREVLLYPEREDLVEIGSGIGEYVFKEEFISKGISKKGYEEEEGLVEGSLDRKLFSESLIPGVKKEEQKLGMGTPFGMDITGPVSTRKILYMEKFPLPNWVEEKGISLHGRLNFWVKPNGEVFKVEVLNSFGFPEIDKLASRMIQRWRFEKLLDEKEIQWGTVDIKILLK